MEHVEAGLKVLLVILWVVDVIQLVMSIKADSKILKLQDRNKKLEKALDELVKIKAEEVKEHVEKAMGCILSQYTSATAKPEKKKKVATKTKRKFEKPKTISKSQQRRIAVMKKVTKKDIF
jgi:biopolymer transport protein ExbB/TolQ